MTSHSCRQISQYFWSFQSTVSSLWLFHLPDGSFIRSPFSSRSYTLRLLGSHFPCSSIARMVSRTWAWGLCPGGWGSWMAKSTIIPLATNCCLQNSRTRTAYWSGGISLGMVSTHRLASWEFHCFSTASAAFHKVLRSAYSGGAFAGSRISLWTIPRFSG